jgi:hypothetical protein
MEKLGITPTREMFASTPTVEMFAKLLDNLESSD